MSDIPRPFKQELPQYRIYEERLLKMIYEKFLGSPLTAEEEKELARIDDAMLWYDLENLLGERPAGERPELKIRLDYAFRPFQEVEKEYLELFESGGQSL